MSVSRKYWLALVVTLALASPVSAQHPPASSAPRGARTVVYHPRDLVALRARLHYTTLIVLPDGEEVVEATCGDKEFWIVNVRAGLVSVKPAKAGGETNLNVIATSGHVYSFVLSEVSGQASADVDLTVYLEPEDVGGLSPAGRQKFVPAQQVDDYRAQLEMVRETARRETDAAKAALDTGLAEFRTSYPLSLRFAYRFKTQTKPFSLQTMFHDDHRTFIRASARELPALYEYKDGRPSLVNFDVRDGVYVVPKVLDDGYFQLGATRVGFRRIEGQ